MALHISYLSCIIKSMNIYIIKNIPKTLKPLSFLKDGTEVMWWIDSDKTKNDMCCIQTKYGEFSCREGLIKLEVEFKDLPDEIKGFLVLYNNNVDQLKRGLGKQNWPKFLALHFKEC